MAFLESMEQGRDDIKFEGKYTKPIPTSFHTQLYIIPVFKSAL